MASLYRCTTMTISELILIRLALLQWRPAGRCARFILYGGWTFANTPIGRDLDDSASDKDSLVCHVKTKYGEPAIFEAKVLRFCLRKAKKDVQEAIKLARDDHRPELFESLLVNSLGLTGLNIANPGGVICLNPCAAILSLSVKQYPLLRIWT